MFVTVVLLSAKKHLKKYDKTADVTKIFKLENKICKIS